MASAAVWLVFPSQRLAHQVDRRHLGLGTRRRGSGGTFLLAVVSVC